ncbi:MAG: LysM peptidoglycan-binding domain-containing protein [Betaproteobacteria bacterium]
MTNRPVASTPYALACRVVRRCASLAGALLAGVSWAQAPAGVSPAQLQSAQRVAEQGVPLADLAPDAPASYTVRPGDTLWGISQLFLKSPWRWAELWGMNRDQVRDPHRLYPGQVLMLSKGPQRATLQVAQPVVVEPPQPMVPSTVKLLARVRSGPPQGEAIASVPAQLIAPFITQATVLGAGEIEGAPRIVAAQDGRSLMTKGEIVYVLGELQGRRQFQLVREPQALKDPHTREILGYEARLVGSAEILGAVEAPPAEQGQPLPGPARALLKEARLEAGLGDRLTQAPAADFAPFVPQAPARPVQGQVIGLYGDGLTAAQHQIVSLNRGARDGLERGHVLALWRDGSTFTDRTDTARQSLRLPDERSGQMFVFQVFDRVSYALILNTQDAVAPGTRFSQP